VVGLLFGAASICYAGWSLANGGSATPSEQREDGVEFRKVEHNDDEEVISYSPHSFIPYDDHIFHMSSLLFNPYVGC
jgi:hypothetical protein